MTISRKSSRREMTSSTVAHFDVSRSRSSVGVSLNGTKVRSHSYEAFMARLPCDLVKESHVRIAENPEVGVVVAQHRDARRPHPERPASVSIGIDAGGADDGRMHHAG